jgi:hypothetical protein
LTWDQDGLKRKNEELAMAYKEKSRKLLQIQELYDKLKRKAMLGQIQDAAIDAADSALIYNGTAGGPALDPSQKDSHQAQLGIPFETKLLSRNPNIPSTGGPPVGMIIEEDWSRPRTLPGEFHVVPLIYLTELRR